MKKLSDFLERFAKLAQTSDDAKSAVIAALMEAGIRVNPDIKYVTIRGSTASLKLSAIQKSEVALKQKRIIEELSKNPFTKHITVVR